MLPILCKEILIPGVPSETQLNIQASNRLAIAALTVLLFGVVLAIAHRRRRTSLIAVVCSMIGTAALVIHPVWTIPTDEGDCGILRLLGSWAVLGVESVLVASQLFLLLWRRNSRAAELLDYDDRLN